MPLPGQARIHTCPPVDDSGIDTIASDDGGHRGMGGGGGEEQGWIVGEGECLSEYETLCTGSVRSKGGGEVIVCARE